MDDIIAEMIAEVRGRGGVPPTGRQNLLDAVTVEPSLGLIILWYNEGQSTRVLTRNLPARE